MGGTTRASYGVPYDRNVVISFDINGVPDSGAAIAAATQQAHASGYTHVSVNRVQQIASQQWRIFMFCANSAPTTRRGPGWAGDHWCESPDHCRIVNG